MGKKKLAWIILIILILILFGYLLLVVSGISGKVIESVENLWGYDLG